MSNKKSSYEQLMADPKRRKEFEEGYAELCLQEDLLRVMEEQRLTVRALAKKAGVSKTTVQTARTGDLSTISLAKLRQIIHAMDLDYEIVLKTKL